MALQSSNPAPQRLRKGKEIEANLEYILIISDTQTTHQTTNLLPKRVFHMKSTILTTYSPLG